MKLAKKWPKLMQDWRSVEVSMRRFGAPRLGWKSTTLAVVLLVLAFSKYTHLLTLYLYFTTYANTRLGGTTQLVLDIFGVGRRPKIIQDPLTIVVGSSTLVYLVAIII